MQAINYEKLIFKYNNGRRNIFQVVCVFSIVGYLIDFAIFYQKYAIMQQTYHVVSLLVCIFSLVMVLFRKEKHIEFYFGLISYTAFINIYVSHVFYNSFLEMNHGGATGILSRDVFFMLCYISLAGFISSRKHIVIQGLIVISLILYYLISYKSPFLVENGPVYILVIVGFCIVMFFFTSVVKESLNNLNQSNAELIETNQELLLQREELGSTLEVLQNTQQQLIRSEKMASLGVLSAGVAHEINNPLNFIQGGIYGIEEYFKVNLKDHINEVAPLISGIKTGIMRSSQIVTSLNQFSRQGDSGDEICDIHSIIDSCLTMLQNEIKFKVDVIKNYCTEFYSILGNEGKLHQVFLNILSNASQAIEKKGSIAITTIVKSNYFNISIKDTGIGISAENLNKVSDPFFTTKDTGKGVGLGLSIVYTIIKEHNGTIEFKSDMGVGTEVIVKLPIQV